MDEAPPQIDFVNYTRLYFAKQEFEMFDTTKNAWDATTLPQSLAVASNAFFQAGAVADSRSLNSHPGHRSRSLDFFYRANEKRARSVADTSGSCAEP